MRDGKTHGWWARTFLVRSGKDREEIGEDEEHRNAQSIVAGKVGFIPSHRLVREMKMECRLERDGEARRLKKSPYSLEERVALAHEFMEKNMSMTVADYARITRLSRSSATVELRRLRMDEESGITTKGRAPHLVYVRG